MKPDTDQGHVKARHRQIALSASAAAVAKLVSLSTVFISVPLTLSYLGAERFGLWMTISSILAMLSFSDLGIGNGLVNAIANSSGKNDLNAVRNFISSALAVLVVLASTIVIVFWLAYPFISWTTLFNLKATLAIEEARHASAVLVTCFALSIPLGVVQRTQIGMQFGYLASMLQAFGSLLGLGATLLAIHFKLGLGWLVGGMAGGPVVASVIGGIYFFGYSNRQLMPSGKLVSRSAISAVMRTGFLFMTLQVTSAVAFYSDNLVIASVVGAAHVADYAVTDRLFSVIPVVVGMLLMPLWPAYGEASSRGDQKWVVATFRRSLLVTFIGSSVGAVFIFTFSEEILKLWVGGSVQPPLMLLAGFALWKVIEACGNAASMLLNGSNAIAIQVLCSVLVLASVIPVKILLVRDVGPAGAVWATIICYVVFALIPYAMTIPRVLSRGA